MTDFLLELLSEEIPARMQAKARADLERLFVAQMAGAGQKASDITVYSTPRRLALIAKGLPEQTEAVSEEIKGPPEGAPDQAVDGFCRKSGVTREQLEVREIKGRPTYFAVINNPGQDTKDVLAESIPAIIKAFPWPKSMRWGDASLSTESLRWVRPLSGIVAIFGDDLVESSIDGVTSGFETVGHRFHHDGPRNGKVTIGNAGDYAEKLRACHVLVDHEERQDIVREGAVKAASEAGLELIADEGLVVENAGLTEWPVPLLGSFDPAFLDVPEEVIQLTARVNQKYFFCSSPLPLAGGAGGGPEDAGNPTPNPSRLREGNLAPKFVCTANIDASDGGKAIVAGNEKVLAARLADAKFFWELDQKTPLEDHAKKLSNIVFHEKLGTVADKVERVAKLAEWLVSLEGNGFDQFSPGDTFHSEVSEAARLCKADLVTEMVGEFPDLQGVMGGYYAEKQGKSAAVANAIRDHYKPVGQGDEVPTDPVTVAVSLADKLDTLISFFAYDMRPTGSKNPFALRRSAIAVIALILENNIRIELSNLLFKKAGELLLKTETSAAEESLKAYTVLEPIVGRKAAGNAIIAALEGSGKSPEEKGLEIVEKAGSATTALLDFFADRLKVQQREAGVRHDLIDAVFALGGEDDLVRLLARVKALQAFLETGDGENLLAGYKRASNILKKEVDSSLPFRGGTEGGGEPPQSSAEDSPHPNPSPEEEGLKELSYTPEPVEKALIDALDAAGPQVTTAIEVEDFEKAMTSLAALRVPIDQFFEEVTVNDDDPAKREARLALLGRFRDAVHQVADFSKIEG